MTPVVLTGGCAVAPQADPTPVRTPRTRGACRCTWEGAAGPLHQNSTTPSIGRPAVNTGSDTPQHSPKASTSPVAGFAVAATGSKGDPSRTLQVGASRVPCATTGESPRHLALVPPSECEVVCGHVSPLLTGFVCVNDPHEPGPHYYAKAVS